MAVSYSGITTYDECPSKFKRKYILKEHGGPEPTRETAPAMFRGTDIHNSIEDMLNGKTHELHKEITKFHPFVKGLRTEGAIAEEAFAYTKDWEPVDFDSPDAEVRGFLDAKLYKPEFARVFEWKTGKEYESHALQRSLYGLVALLEYEEVPSVTVETHYLDIDKIVPTIYYRENLITYKWSWDRRINKTKPPQPYPMRPSWKCKWCPYSRKQGGACPN